MWAFWKSNELPPSHIHKHCLDVLQHFSDTFQSLHPTKLCDSSRTILWLLLPKQNPFKFNVWLTNFVSLLTLTPPSLLRTPICVYRHFLKQFSSVYDPEESPKISLKVVMSGTFVSFIHSSAMLWSNDRSCRKFIDHVEF